MCSKLVLSGLGHCDTFRLHMYFLWRFMGRLPLQDDMPSWSNQICCAGLRLTLLLVPHESSTAVCKGSNQTIFLKLPRTKTDAFHADLPLKTRCNADSNNHFQKTVPCGLSFRPCNNRFDSGKVTHPQRQHLGLSLKKTQNESLHAPVRLIVDFENDYWVVAFWNILYVPTLSGEMIHFD